jgi:hypothetical protein
MIGINFPDRLTHIIFTEKVNYTKPQRILTTNSNNEDKETLTTLNNLTGDTGFT